MCDVHLVGSLLLFRHFPSPFSGEVSVLKMTEIFHQLEKAGLDE